MMVDRELSEWNWGERGWEKYLLDVLFPAIDQVKAQKEKEA